MSVPHRGQGSQELKLPELLEHRVRGRAVKGLREAGAGLCSPAGTQDLSS